MVLFTTDGAGGQLLKCGTNKDMYATVDFGPGKYFFTENHFNVNKLNWCFLF